MDIRIYCKYYNDDLLHDEQEDEDGKRAKILYL